MKELVNSMKRINHNLFTRYFKIWLLMAKNAFSAWLTRKSSVAVFLAGKIIRYIFYFSSLYFLVERANGLAGYNAYQALFFTATYTFVDTFAQVLFRNVYTYRQMVVSGDLDLVLVKPINALFRIVLGGPDIIDLITIPPILFVLIYIGSFLNPTLTNVIYFILLLINSIIISLAFHIAIVAFGTITLEIDHTMLIFRDLSSMGRIPIEVYKEPLKSLITYILPIGIMMSFPAKAMIGLISFWGVIGTLLVGVLLLILSLKYWQFALKKYTSASS